MLHVLRSPDNHTLWHRCVGSFLDELGDATGPDVYASHLWLTQRAHRDAMIDAARVRGLRGWLQPPFSYMGEVPRRFGITQKTVGLLTRRRLVSRIAARHARRHGIGVATEDSGVVRGHMLDGLLGELLPEGVSPERLERALAGVADDGFARRRNAWIIDTYRDYLEQLRFRDLYDFRSINAMLADRIDAGGLRKAIGGAGTLHVYGLHSVRTRRRLLEALHRQDQVDVRVYTTAEEEEGEWDRLSVPIETIPAPAQERTRRVQPVPNPRREFAWIAARVKRLIAEHGAEPRSIAVIARTGREDTRRMYEALQRAGVPATARIRTPLAEVPALRTVLELFRGAAEGWHYRTLRHVLASPYFDLRADLRWVDFIAARRRPETLARWQEELERLIERRRRLDQRDAQRNMGEADGEQERRYDDPDTWRAERELRAMGAWLDRMERDLERLVDARRTLEPMAERRSERQWVTLTLELVRDGWSGLRRRVCDVPPDRYHVVRVDQRGLTQLEGLLLEWAELEPDDGEPLPVAQWYTMLRQLLQSHELALTTPQQRGVQVLEAHDAALTPFTHVHIVHANDGVFPNAPRTRGVLGDAERTRLRERLGLSLADFATELREERSLWRAVTANPDVVVSYRTTDPSGTPLLPSLMAERVLPREEWAKELPRSFEPVGEPVTVDELQREAVRALVPAARAAPRPDHAPAVTVPDPQVVRHAVLNAYAEQARAARGHLYDEGDPPEPSAWSGRIEDPRVLTALEERFGDGHVWSVSQLHAYARCPFTFFVEKVLRLSGQEEAEEETTALTFGSLAHAILDAYYRPLVDGNRAPSGLTDAERARLDEVAERVIGERETAGEWLGTPVLWELKKRDLLARLREYLEWELRDGFQPGERPWESEWILSSEDGAPILLRGRDLAGAERAMRLTGRIDRVDVIDGPDGPRYRVLDYKSGRIPEPRHYDDGVELQAALYMHALAQADGLSVELGRYRSIRDPRDWSTRFIEFGDRRYEFMLGVAFTIPGRVRRGMFEPIASQSRGWADWDPPLEVRRSSAQLAVKGGRWEGESP